MVFIALKPQRNYKDYTFQPYVSILVPTYNEKNVIRNRIENLISMNYPGDKYEIIVVDSGSGDGTAEIVDSFMKEYHDTDPALRLIREERRKGKASAINTGKNHSKGDIVLVTDANCIFDKNVLREMMPHFKDPSVGAVGGRYIVANPENALTSSESYYWDLEYLMRCGESSLDSACLFHGEINAWRRDLVEADTSIISEDLDICMQIRRKKYKIVYEPDAKVYEPSATNVKDQIIRKKKVVIGTIKCMFKHMPYLLSPDRDLYNTLIFPSHKILAIFSPFILLIIPVLYIIAFDLGYIIHLILTLSIFSVLYATLTYVKSKKIKNENVKKFFSPYTLLNIVYYVLLNEYLILLGWKDFFLGKYSVLWEKAESARIAILTGRA
jgi:cellulose synthase/poly-beta-1,6-N-acetylglucosamine synthase-like glycosyltransferase